MTKIDVSAARLALRMTTGSAIEAMEAAKTVIRSNDSQSVVLLIDIAVDRSHRKWSRIAAVYALGFLGHSAATVALLRILPDVREDLQLRAHVAEALGNMRETRSLPVLRSILMSDAPAPLKKWCIYAASEIGGPKAHAILKLFAKTHPAGMLKKELEAALSR